MPTYQDKTFCTFFANCRKAETCKSKLTPEIIREANKAQLPVEKYNFQPWCFKRKSK